MPKAFLVIILFLLFSCSTKRESPVIYFSNASTEIIKNIHCEWGENQALTLQNLIPGESRSQSFYIEDDKEFFGLVRVFWQSISDKTLEREFYFRDVNLPSISNSETYNYVQIYFDQDGIEVVSSDVADLSNKNQRMDTMMVQYRAEYLKNNPDDLVSLIRIDPRKDRSVPYWLINSQ